MSEATITTIVIAAVGVIPATIMAYAVLVTARQGKKTNEKTAENTEKILEKTDENTLLTKGTKEAVEIVHTQTNGHLSKVTEQLEAANVKLESSQQHNQKLEQLLISLAELTKKNGKGSAGST